MTLPPTQIRARPGSKVATPAVGVHSPRPLAEGGRGGAITAPPGYHVATGLSGRHPGTTRVHSPRPLAEGGRGGAMTLPPTLIRARPGSKVATPAPHEFTPPDPLPKGVGEGR